MSAPPPSDVPDHPRDAAQWFARMHSGDVTEQDRQAFDAWLAADPEHEQQYQHLRFLWDASLLIPPERLRGMMTQDAPAPPPALSHAGLSRRRVGLGLAAAGALAVMALGVRGRFTPPTDSMAVSTRKGERRKLTLPDGSELHLNTDTLAHIRFYDDLRQVELQRGEVLLQVRKDAARPFVVDAGLGQVTVTGTRFNVRRDAKALQVSVESGSVLMRSGHWWNRSEQHLGAGQQAIAHAEHGLGLPQAANIGNIVAWQRGKIIFSDMPLSQVIAEMNRYLPQPARLVAPQLGNHRISGVFGIDDPQAMINALPAIAPVRVLRLKDGAVRIAAQD